MKKSRPYQAMNVKDVKVVEMLRGRQGVNCTVGIDASKGTLRACVRWSNGGFERPWRVNFEDLRQFIAVLGELRAGREVRPALEPTGVYGDPIRQALRDAGFQVYRVSPKASHDYAEVFDGVPSQHDGKDAACVAELTALGKCSVWPDDEAADRELRLEVEWLDARQRSLTCELGRLEALLGRHWPELTKFVKLNSATALKVLRRYGGPQGVAQDRQAVRQLCKWGGAKLDVEKARSIVQTARTTAGVRQSAAEVRHLQRVVAEIMRIRTEVKQSQRQLGVLTQEHPKIPALATIVGPGTAAVCWTHLGDPAKYDSPRSYLKAYGLNLIERSSGRYEGQLKISKRGPSRPRRWLYFAALRYVQKPSFNPWFQAQKCRGKGQGKRALVIVMKKLVLAMYRVGRGAAFDEKKLLPGAQAYAARQNRQNRQTARRPAEVVNP